MTYNYRKAIMAALDHHDGRLRAVTFLDAEHFPDADPIMMGVILWDHRLSERAGDIEHHAQRWLWRIETAEATLTEAGHVTGDLGKASEAYEAMGGSCE